MKNILLIDFSWLFVRLYYVNNTNKDHINGTIRYISSISKLFDKTYVVLDGENGSIKKKELLPSYKEGRSNKVEIYNNLDATLNGILKQTKAIICRNNDREADEVIATIAIKLSKKNKVTIFSGDKDMLQLAYLPNVTIANSYKGSKVNIIPEEDILNKFEISKLEDVLKFRVFKGDSSDKIKPPIPRFPKKSINLVLENWNTNTLTDEVFNSITENISDSNMVDKLIEAKDRIFMNFKLMNLYNAEEQEEILDGIRKIKNGK